MRGHAFADMEDLDRPGRNARPQLFLYQRIGHRVIMLVDRDVVIDPGATLLPLGVNVGLHR